MPRTMPVEPSYLRASFSARPIGVDREKNVLMGYVVAQKGVFKSERGQFDDQDLNTIFKLGNASGAGLKSRLAHPTLSDDGIGKFLGRSRGFWMDGLRVRANLHFDKTAFDTPSGNLAKYVMDLAESDPEAISSSLVLQVKEEFQLDAKGKPLLDEGGEPLPPLWRPTKLHASDIVDTGDAVDGLLSSDALPDAAVRKGCELLDSVFAGQPWEVVEARCLAWLSRYRQHRKEPEGGFLIDDPSGEFRAAIQRVTTPALADYKLKLQAMDAAAKMAKRK